MRPASFVRGVEDTLLIRSRSHSPDDDATIAVSSTASTAVGSQQEPIVIDSSPERTSTKHRPSGLSPYPTDLGSSLTHSFGSRQGTTKRLPKSRRKTGETDNAKWPDKSNQHLRGPQRHFSSTPIQSLRLRSHSDLVDQSGHISASITHLRNVEDLHPMYLSKCPVEPIGSQPDGHARCESILHSSAKCPAIQRFLTADYDISGSSWNERWRPRRAAEVIGNEELSIFLRDWLLALEIKSKSQENCGSSTDMTTVFTRNTKRPKVLRSVENPRKRRRQNDSDEESLGDWMIDDEESNHSPISDQPTDEEWPEDSESGSPWKPKLSRLSRRCPPDNGNAHSEIDVGAPTSSLPSYDFSNYLTNTILLTGPSGSGKTAAVYACAEELGWEVFEVYPGIGKRNGASLLSLVGDVGKNHIVNHGSRPSARTREKQNNDAEVLGQTSAEAQKGGRKTAPPVFASFFNPLPNLPKVPANSSASELPESERILINVEEREPTCVTELGCNNSLSFRSPGATHPLTPSEKQETRNSGPRQSIILLEEVDILYGEDVNFWAAVVNLIKESRRPVVMTCNGILAGSLLLRKFN